MKRTKSTIKFVGLHAHSVAGSIFDALGLPDEHMDSAYANGMDALALTDHGNANGLSYQVLHAKKMAAEGRVFKPIFGCEAYFIPSIADWREDYATAMADKKKAKALKKEAKGGTSEDEGSSKKKTDPLRRRRHLVLLAQNQKGLNNLFALISASHAKENFYRYPRMDYDMLEKHNEGIIAASACLGGIYAGSYWEHRDEGTEAVLEAMRESTRRMVDIFGDRWYPELQWHNIPEQHELNKFIIQIAEEFNLKLISTADSHYPTKAAWRDRELYKRLGWLGRGKPSFAEDDDFLPKTIEDTKCELYPKNGDQMWENYKRFSEINKTEYDDEVVRQSIEETYAIAHERIESFMPDTTVRLPDFVVPDGLTDTQAIVKIAIEGLKNKGLNNKPEYVERLKHELGVINDRGFSKYFLTMAAIIDVANKSMLVGPGRGSAVGSLTAYVLGITQVDPIAYDLPFERFLRSDAVDYPDIDTDISDSMLLKEKLVEMWGDDCVAPISNWNTLQVKSLVKDISKLHGVPFNEVNTVTSAMGREAMPEAKRLNNIVSGVHTPNWDELRMFSPSLKQFLMKYPEVEEQVGSLVGQRRSNSRHAGGLLVSENLNSNMPLINSGGVIQSPWSEGQNVRHLEPLGFIKFDLLGLSTLRMIEGCIEHILKRHHGTSEPTFAEIKKYYDDTLHPDVLDLTDQKVYEYVFRKGNFAGTFQFSNDGAQGFCKEVAPKTIAEISAVTSIFRPGPLAGRVNDQYIAAKDDPTDIKWYHPIFREITEETFGHIIYQEQISEITHRIGKDISRDDGNTIRKLLTKKGTGKEHLLVKFREQFIEGANDNGMTIGTAEEIWDLMAGFAKYGFSKNHATAYSIISYQCAWLWTHFPSEWAAAFLDKEPESRKEKAINIVKSSGFELAPLDINKSGRVWEISDDSKTLIQPLTSIKGLGDAAIVQVLENRPFTTAEELLFKEGVTYSKLNKKCLDALCRGGALDGLVDERFTGRKHFWSACIVDRPKTEKRLKDNIGLYKPEGDFSEEEIIQFKTDLTGVFPMNLVINEQTIEKLKERHVPPISEFDPELHLCWFIPRKVIPKKTKKGEDYWIVEVIDSNNELTKIRCWGIRKGKDRIHLNKPYMSRLKYDPKWGFSTYAVGKTFRLLG